MSDQSFVNRRTVLAGTGIVAVGVAVAACAPGSDEEANPEIKGTNVGASGTVLAAVADVPVGGGVVVSDPPIVVTQPKAGEVKGFTAICPHAGCLVSSVQNDEIICPCHGSHYDTAGRIRKGPAPKNLLLPEYKFLSDNKIIIG